MRSVLIAMLALSSVAVPAQQNKGQGNANGSANKPVSTQQSAQSDRGSEVFQRNCMRCHNPPQGFSPRISQTVAMHMREKANLSEEDYKALVRFLNP